MRKLSWMAVVVVVGGGFLGITRFTGMWGRGGSADTNHHSITSTSGWQFERPGEKDGLIHLRATADDGLRALPKARMALEPESSEPVNLPEPEPVAAQFPDSPARTEPQTFAQSEPLDTDLPEPASIVIEPSNTELLTVDATQPTVAEPLATKPAAIETNLVPQAPAEVEMEQPEDVSIGTPEDIYIEYPAVADAEHIDTHANELVTSMSVMAATEHESPDWPTETYDVEPARTYVVSPPVAWAAERKPLIEPRVEDRPLIAQRRQTKTDELGGLHGVIDATYVSRFIWRGYDVYANNHSAFQPSVDLDLFGTGFGLNVWMSRANGSGFEDSEWLAYTGYYKGSLFDDEIYATYYKIGYTYFSYPDTPRAGNPLIAGTGDAQEVFGAFQWPNLLPGGIVPSYAVFAYWPSESKSTVSNNGGWAHVFGLNKDISFESIFGNQPEQVLHMGAHAVYNDGVGPAGKTADHDWSHAVFSVSTDFDLGNGFMVVPGFNYQSSWDDSINTSDEYWTSLTVSYSF